MCLEICKEKCKNNLNAFAECKEIFINQYMENPGEFLMCGFTGSVYDHRLVENFFYNDEDNTHGCLFGEISSKKVNCYEAIMFFDLVALKAFNDRFDYKVGGLLIKRFAEFLKNEVKENPINDVNLEVFRRGGDEFCVFAFPIGMDCNNKIDTLEKEELIVELQSLETKILDKWKGITWELKRNFALGRGMFELEPYSKNVDLKPTEKQRIFLKGLRARGGVGKTMKEAEKNAKKSDYSYARTTAQRGVVNDEVEIYTNEYLKTFLPDNWKKLRDYIIISYNKERGSKQQSIISSVNSVLKNISHLNKEKGSSWNQDGGNFIAIPISYSKYDRYVVHNISECDELSEYSAAIRHMPWLDYFAYIQGQLQSIVDETNVFYLNGR